MIWVPPPKAKIKKTEESRVGKFMWAKLQLRCRCGHTQDTPEQQQAGHKGHPALASGPFLPDTFVHREDFKKISVLLIDM